jgi:ankyrin repeat protein
LSLPDLDINQQDSLGNTALHQASKAGRLAIVKLLLEQPNINDFLDNKSGRNVVDVAKSSDIVQLIHGKL